MDIKLLTVYLILNFLQLTHTFIPCMTCLAKNSIECCKQQNRCCETKAIKTGNCPQNVGKCTYKCLEDKNCATDEKCCSQDPSFPSKICSKTTSCPKSVRKSLKAKNCKTQDECDSNQLCCVDPRKSGCCVKYTSIAVTTSTATTTEKETTEIETTTETETTTEAQVATEAPTEPETETPTEAPTEPETETPEATTNAEEPTEAEATEAQATEAEATDGATEAEATEAATEAEATEAATEAEATVAEEIKTELHEDNVFTSTKSPHEDEWVPNG